MVPTTKRETGRFELPALSLRTYAKTAEEVRQRKEIIQRELEEVRAAELEKLKKLGSA